MFQSPLISPRGNTAEISTPRRTRQSRTPDSTAAATARAVPRDERVATTSAARGADAKCASAAGFVCVFVTAGPITKLCPILFVSACTLSSLVRVLELPDPRAARIDR